jgi:hypothetical protein
MPSREPPLGYSEVLGGHATNPTTPRMVGESVDALGRTWTVASDEGRIKAQFEQFLRQEARKAAEEALRDGDVRGAQRLDAAYIAGRAAGDYNWGGRAWLQFISGGSNLVGLMYLFYLMLRRCHPDITEETAALIFKEQPRRVSEIIRWALGNFLSLGLRTSPGDSEETTEAMDDRSP